MAEESPTEHKTLLEALLNVQRQMPRIQKDRINPAFRSKYVSLDALTEAVTPVLTANHLIWTTFPSFNDHGPTLRYRLTHVPSGETIDGEMLMLLSKQDPQGLGSATTYARRQSMTAVLNITTSEDDDGNRASRKQDNGAAAETVTAKDVEEIKDALRGLGSDQIQLAFAAVGLDGTKPFGTIPRAKAAALVQALMGIERTPV